MAGKNGSAIPRKRSGRRRSIAVAGVALALVAAGVGIGIAVLAKRDTNESPSTPPTSEEGARRASRSAPLPRFAPAPPPSPAPLIDPRTVAWPDVPPELRALAGEGRSLVERAAEAFQSVASGEAGTEAPRRIAEADRAMAAGLERLHRAQVETPALRGWHHDSILRALKSRRFDEVERRARLSLERYPDDLFSTHALLAALNALRKDAEAIQVATAVLETRPNDVDAREVLASALRRQGRWAEAAAAAERLARSKPNELRVFRLLAECAAQLGDRERGIAAVLRVLELVGWPDRVDWSSETTRDAMTQSISILHRFREWPTLRDVGTRFLTARPDELWALTPTGIAWLETGDPARAEPLLRRALGDGVDTEEERFHLGLALAKRGRTEDAVAELADLLAIDPWFERAYYQLGLSLARLGRTDDAEIFFERARSLAASERDIRREREHQAAGDPVLAARSRARGHLARNQFEEAEAALRKPELDGEPAHLVDRIYLYLHSLRIDDARRELERLESIVGETHQSVIGHRALIAWELGDRDRALHELRTLASGANAARVWRLRFAELLIDAERYEEAARLVSPLRTSAKDADATIVLGRAKLELDEPAAAADLLAPISPTDTRRDAWSVDAWLALALARAGKPQRALETLGERGAHGRGREVELRARAAALEALGAMGEAAQADVDAAKNAFARARRIAPEIRSLRERVARTRWRSDCEARLELARAFASAGDIDAAIREARLILHACPNHAGALENLVDWHDRPGDAFVRIDLLRRLVEARPDDPEAKRRLRELEAVWIASRERTKPSQ